MKKIETPLDGAFIIEPQVFGDVRGWFYESYSKQKMHDIGKIGRASCRERV